MTALFLSLALAVISAPEPGYDALLEDAVRARNEGRLEDSLTLLRKANALQSSPGLRNNIARVLEELGRWREAVDEYRSVAGDPRADPQLRALDDQRIAELAPRLLSAWIALDVAPESARVFLDGRPVVAQGGHEERVPPGVRVVEGKLEGEVVLEVVDAPAGRRTVISRDLSAPARNEARVAIDGVRGVVQGVVVDRYRMRSAVEEVSIIRLREGLHTIELEAKGTGTSSRTVDLGAGLTFDAASILEAKMDVSHGRSARIWPYFAGGGGVVAAAVGGVLIGVAEASRGEINNAAKCADGVRICGVTQARAEEIELAARSKSTAGWVLVGAGAAAIAGAIAGWLLE